MFNSTKKRYISLDLIEPLSIDIEIEEKKAPTDESIKILMEYEEKIKEKIFLNMRCTNNLISYSLCFRKDIISGLIMNCKFTFNGKDFINEFKSTHLILKDIVDDMLKQINDWIIRSILDNDRISEEIQKSIQRA